MNLYNTAQPATTRNANRPRLSATADGTQVRPGVFRWPVAGRYDVVFKREEARSAAIKVTASRR
jgi:hypothetical protein